METSTQIFTINRSNDVFLRKDVPFGSLENKFIFWPIPQKRKFSDNFWRHLENLYSKNLNIGDAPCKLPLIVIVAPWKFYNQ